MSRNDSKTVASPKRAPAWVTVLKAGDLEHIAQSAGNSKGWIKSFLGDSVKLNLFQVGHLASASSRLLGWPLLLSGSLDHLRVFFAASSFWKWLLRRLSVYSWEGGAEGTWSVPGTSWSSLELFIFCFKAPPCRMMEYFLPKETAT